MKDSQRKAMWAGKKINPPDLWVNGIPLNIVVDSQNGAINVSSVRFNESDKGYFHDQHIFSANEKVDKSGHQNKFHEHNALDLEKKYNGGKPFKNTLHDYKIIAKIADKYSGVHLGAYKHYGATRESLKKKGIPT